jgi:hypothetical protein
MNLKIKIGILPRVLNGVLQVQPEFHGLNRTNCRNKLGFCCGCLDGYKISFAYLYKAHNLAREVTFAEPDHGQNHGSDD